MINNNIKGVYLASWWYFGTTTGAGYAPRPGSKGLARAAEAQNRAKQRDRGKRPGWKKGGPP